MQSRLLPLVLPVAIVLGLTGCGQESPRAGAPQTHTAFKPAAQPEAETPPQIELKTVKYRDVVAAVKAQKGKVLVVDIWAEY